MAEDENLIKAECLTNLVVKGGMTFGRVARRIVRRRRGAGAVGIDQIAFEDVAEKIRIGPHVRCREPRATGEHQRRSSRPDDLVAGYAAACELDGLLHLT